MIIISFLSTKPLVHDEVNRQFRHELKYYLTYTEYAYLKNLLEKALEYDTNANENGEYFIRSLYFDSVDHECFYDKDLGIEDRKKIRLRIYDPNSETAKLEIKHKNGSVMLKDSCTVSKEDALELVNGNLDVLLKYDKVVANNVYYIMHRKPYFPNVIVDYEREAFVGKVDNIRITFDKNVRSSKNCSALFDENLMTSPNFYKPVVVLEVKYDNILPRWLRKMLSTVDTLQKSVSKFTLGNMQY